MEHARTSIRDVGDLPRYAYPVTGRVSRYLGQHQDLAPLVAKLKADASATLIKYDIQDGATLAQIHRILRDIAIYERDSAGFRRENQILRSLQTKHALAAWVGTPEEAQIAALSVASPGTPEYDEAFKKALRSKLDTLNWVIVGQTVTERHRGLATIGQGVARGAIDHALQPAVDAAGTLDMNGMARLVAAANFERDLLPLADAEREVEASWIAAARVARPDIWQARTISLTAADHPTPVVIGIWDEGVDTELFGPQLWTNPNETSNGVDDDGNGWIDDVHGVAVDVLGNRAVQPLAPLSPELHAQLDHLASVSKGIADIQAGIESVDATRTTALYRTISEDEARKLFTALRCYASYAHGTHVAGIAIEGNPAARLLVARTSFDWRSPPRRPTEETARAFGRRHKEIVDYLRAAGARVVNISWTVSLKDEYENQLTANGVAPGEAASEGIRLFQIERQALYEAMKDAPEILFVVAAGNGNDSADFSGAAPASFALPNVLVVAALDQAGEPTNFTASGSTVAIAASGYQVESLVPGGQRVRWSGTSMASPQVTNIAAKLFALNPRLTPTEVREILISTATSGGGGLKQLHGRAAVERATSWAD